MKVNYYSFIYLWQRDGRKCNKKKNMFENALYSNENRNNTGSHTDIIHI